MISSSKSCESFQMKNGFDEFAYYSMRRCHNIYHNMRNNTVVNPNKKTLYRKLTISYMNK